MKYPYVFIVALAIAMFGAGGAGETGSAPAQNRPAAGLGLQSNLLKPDPTGGNSRSLRLDGIFYETAEGRVILPPELTAGNSGVSGKPWKAQSKMADGRVVTVAVSPEGKDFAVRMSAAPDAGILKWGISISANEKEYFTGLMERVVDGPQQASWAPGLETAMICAAGRLI